MLVHISLISRGAADLIVSALLAKGYGVQPGWPDNDDSIALVQENNTCVLMSLIVGKAKLSMTDFHTDLNKIVADKKLSYYCATITDTSTNSTMSWLGNIFISKNKSHSGKVIPFPKPKTEEVKDDGIIDDDKAPPPN